MEGGNAKFCLEQHWPCFRRPQPRLHWFRKAQTISIL